MSYRYFAIDRESVSGSGEIARGKEAEYFRLVEQLTGLDRAIAEPILHSGRRIEHPRFELRAVRINPFEPVKIVP